MVFPLYHVFADLAEWKDGKIVRSRLGNPLAVQTMAVVGDRMQHLLVANLTPETYGLRSTASQTETVASAGELELTLAPFEVTRLDAPRSVDR
jgi:hypothetical protein